MQNFNQSWSDFFKKPERSFFSIGLIFGLLFLLIVPPFQVPDEAAHFFRAYQISEGEIVAQKQGNTSGGIIPKSLFDYWIIWNQIPFHPEKKVTNSQVSETLNLSLRKTEKQFASFPNTALYSPIPYLPQALGIFLGNAFSLSPLILMYLGRLTNLLASLYITSLAIKVTPAFKWVFFLIVLTPMATFQRASLSADSFINSISILLVATIIKYAFDTNKEKIVTIDIIVLCLLGTLLSLSKHAYLLIPFLCFLIPKYKFYNQTKYFLTCLLIISTGIVTWISWSFVMKGLYVTLNPDVVPASEQAHFVLSHPGKFTLILFNDFKVNIGEYLNQFVGVLGWLDTRLPSVLIISYVTVISFVAVIDSRPNVIILFKNKVKILAVLLASILLIYLLIYLCWSFGVGKEVVEGIQGRYFIPLAPLLFLLFYNRSSLDIRRKNIDFIIVSYSLFALAMSLSVVINRYYNL